MTRRKCFFVLLLAMAMFLLLATPVFAEEISGTCGSNVTWHLDKSTGTMTISGTGPMENSSYAPWGDYRESITKVVIEEGVTSVGSSAFSGCSNLHTVILPTTVTEIKKSAFAYCIRLKSISLDYVTVIDDYAFRYTGLTSVTIPAGVTAINSGTFTDCRALADVQLHNGITLIDSYAFNWCASLTSISIPDSVTEIGGSAFSNCYRLTDVKLSRNLTEMGWNVFSDCENLKKITIPDSLTQIGGYAFSSCSSLEEVILGAGVSTVKGTAFNGCSSLRAFTVGEGNTACSTHGGVLYNRDKTEMILMPEGFQGSYTVLPGTKKICYYACHDVQGLTGIILPDSVTMIDDYAFCGAVNLVAVQLSQNLQNIGTNALSRTAITEIVIPASVTEIEVHAFSSCRELKKITFTGKAPKIQDAAFSQVTATVYYPGNIPGWGAATGLYGGHLKWVSTACKTHQPVAVPGTKATCTEDGMTEGSKCSNCQTILVEQKPISAKGHSYSLYVKENENVHKCTCTVCGYTGEAAHNWDAGVITKSPDCITTGERVYTCVSCEFTKTGEIPPSDAHTYDYGCDPQCNICGKERTVTHKYSDIYTADEQNHWHQCSFCNEKKEITPHTPGAVATEETPQLCTVCDYEIAPALGEEETTEPADQVEKDPDSIEKDPNNGIVIGMVIAAIVVTGGVIAALIMVRKKKQ